MKNKTKVALLLLVLLSMVLVGCTSQSSDDSKNKYKLPLGECGYLAEIDFSLYKNETIATNEDGSTEIVTYDYINDSTDLSVNITTWTLEEDFVGKAIKLVAGYYNESEEFIPFSNEKYIKLENNLGNNSFTYEFSIASEDLSKKETAVLKMCFGTSIDEEVFKEENPNAKKKEIKAVVKKYRSSCFYINELKVGENNLLIEKATINGSLSKEITKENDDLYYYNTATVTYASSTLTLTLNSKSGWWQSIIAGLGKLLYWITKLVGNHYWLAMLIFTIVIRTLGWPIYAKSNSATSGMSKIQPEMEKLNKKYEGKTDQNSKMKQQMEMRELMKKNHVSMWGCLLPFAQMPIFFAVYQVVQRFPLTPIYQDCNYNFLWTTFALDYGEASGDWILAIVVGVTMIGSQELSTYMMKRAQKRKANFYTAKNQTNNNQMRIMMIVMTVMMVAFAWKSSGIAFYWIIGNTYQIAQTIISKYFEEKKADKELIASGKARGR